VNDTRKYLEYDDDNDQLEDYRKPVKLNRPKRPTDNTAGFNVNQGVFKKQNATVRSFDPPVRKEGS
jgi:hypothetical protein